MFFLFHGTDTNKARATALKNIEAAKKKHQGAEFFRLNSDNFSEAKLDELIASQGLFYSASIVLADRLCDEEERAEIVLKKLKDISTSPSFFVFLEAKLNKTPFLLPLPWLFSVTLLLKFLPPSQVVCHPL